MPDGIDLEQKNREEARWRMLRVVDAGRPIAVSEQIIWRVLADIKLSLSLNTVRRELAYLRDLGLLELEGEGGETGSPSSRRAGLTSLSTTFRHRRESRARGNIGERDDEEEKNLELRAEGIARGRRNLTFILSLTGRGDRQSRARRHPKSILSFVLQGDREETSEAGAD